MLKMEHTKKAVFAGMILLISLMFVHPARASTSGNDLLRFCTSDPNSAEQSFCLGYLHGLVDGVMGLSVIEGRPQIFDIPSGADILQVRDVVVKFLKENPKDRHLAAVALVFKALTQAFPPKS
jgi:Ssp1 endopeptidase immunity protein Rap1a